MGCVPSKALLRCARAVAERRRNDLGLAASDSSAGIAAFAEIMARMRRLRAEIAPVDSYEATVQAGADMYMGRAIFVGPHELQVGNQTLRFRKAVIATGGRATVPPIPGLSEIPFLTNTTLFNLEALPPRLAIIGGGAVGVEMAQAFQRFGSKVTLFQRSERILGSEDEDAAKVIHSKLAEEGVDICTGVQIKSVKHTPRTPWPEIHMEVQQVIGQIVHNELVFDALLVATGRSPNVENLGLEAAGVDYKVGVGIHVNDDLTTSNADIFAAGDVIDRPELRFTHMAGAMAGMAVQNALFDGCGLPVNAPSLRLSDVVVPHCTYTEPEVASCGISRVETATGFGIEVDTYMAKLDGNDRNILEGASPDGFVKVLCRRGTDQIVGATIVAERAGDMLAELTLAMQHGLGLAAVARTIHPYPTMGEAVQQCALQYARLHWARL